MLTKTNKGDHMIRSLVAVAVLAISFSALAETTPTAPQGAPPVKEAAPQAAPAAGEKSKCDQFKKDSMDYKKCMKPAKK